MQRTEPEAAERDRVRQATLPCGVASLTATAGRAPFNEHLRIPQGREAVFAMRPPPPGADPSRPARGRPTAPAGPARGALAHARKDAR
ncbi:DUF6380 family protein [Streptomyces sp. NPDC004658]|uniref:DUF6380 family protein n=1 Tax=Streptomyces sp. NPDC004658 TaxID=3154672 RepID=UPI0033A185A0